MRAQLYSRLANRTALEVIPASLALEDDGTPIPMETQAVVPAAVLVPLVERPEGMTVLLTRRAEHLNDHPGQVSFPGGRIESFDKDEIAAALRETEEEIGLDRAHIEVVGCLDDCLTGTGFRVTPVVGLVVPPFTLTLDSSEVAEAFEVPLSFVLDADNHQRRSAVRPDGDRREFYVLPWPENHIWGATARMLVNLHDLLTD